jgi:poly-gamma-glutamate synthesis protein (capsule biosynthesis protein)
VKALALLLLLAAAPLRAVTVSAVGDVLLWYGPMAGTLQELSATARTPWDTAVYPFENVQDSFKGLVFGNLEGPLTVQPKHRYKPAWMKYYFKSPAGEALAALKQGGFRVMSVANNHAMDSGRKGLADTLAALDEGEILAVGAGLDEARARRAVTVRDSRGEAVTFLAYNEVGPKGTFATRRSAGAARLREAELFKDLKQAVRAAKGHPVVVSLHWGWERQVDLPVDDPEPRQRALAHKIIDAGATLVLGHHTHAVSRFEEYGQGLIAYSLGNFLFSGGRMEDRRRSVILRAKFEGKAVTAWDLVPVMTDDPAHPFQPTPMPKAEGQAYLKQVLGPSYARYKPLGGKDLQELAKR